MGRIFATTGLAGAVLITLAAGAAAGPTPHVITVSTTADGGAGSLRQAIAEAAPGDRIVVPAGTYTLTRGELSIGKTLRISGAGAGATAIDAQMASRVVHTTGADNQIAITGVTIRNGKAAPAAGSRLVEGGGILNEGAALALSDDVIASNHADADTFGTTGAGGDAEGGGIFSSGPLTLLRTVLRDNSATALGGAGTPGGLAVGGGAETLRALAVDASTIENNVADARGGQGAASVNQSGGRVQGGGLAVTASGVAKLSASTVADNVADASAGPGGSGGLAIGGGAHVEGGLGSIAQTNITYTGNIARATSMPRLIGLARPRTVTPAIAQTSGGQTFGGGVFFTGDGRDQSLVNVTLTANHATGGSTNSGGNVYVNVDDIATIENTLVTAGSADVGAENCAASGTISSAGHNIETLDQCDFHSPTDHVSTAVPLGPIRDNGGVVQTIALELGSPAVDSGAEPTCPATDARGVLRSAGAGCDVGAFELATPAASTGRPSTIGTNGATVSGTVANPDVAGATAFFDYGTTDAYGTITASQPVAATAPSARLSASLSKLAPETTYHYRVVIVNAVARVFGADQTFTTARPSTTTNDPPRITKARLTPSSLLPAQSTTLTYTDSAAATTTVRLQRRAAGRRPRWANVGRTFTHTDRAGVQRLRFTLRSLASALPAGVYRLELMPRSHGRAGPTVAVTLRVKHGKRRAGPRAA